MLGHSHALSGGVAGLAAGIFMHLPIPQTAALAGFTAGMALLPDLDKCGSSPARSLGFVSEAVAWVFGRISGGHRHATEGDIGGVDRRFAAVDPGVPARVIVFGENQHTGGGRRGFEYQRVGFV